jgi:hypothetical protein
VSIIAAALAVLIVMKIDGRQEEGFSRGARNDGRPPIVARTSFTCCSPQRLSRIRTIGFPKK